MAEWVTVNNPDLPDTPDALVTREFFDLALKDKGFEIVGEAKDPGGTVGKGSEVLVGESGPELVVPPSDNPLNPPAKGKDK